MKKLKHLALFVLFTITSLTVKSQNPGGDQTPNGYFDTIYDRFGNKYGINDLRIPPDDPTGTNAVTCNAGYFKLFFEPGSGLDGPGAPDINRRAVLCQIFSDLSCFIKSPLSSACAATSNTVKVNVYVTDNATPGPAAGTASPLYLMPFNPASATPGIIDNLAWLTITTGQDPYATVAPPVTSNSQSNNFYHIIINVNTALNWYYTLTANTPGANYDFYTVYLHEALHGLGFTSLITENPISSPNIVQSVFSPNGDYYSRYDQFLFNKNLQPLLTNLTSSCSIGTMHIAQPSVLTNIAPLICTPSTPYVSDVTNCGTSAFYQSPSQTIPVYTPDCFERGSSLSHFEDMCYPTVNAANNNQYFLMSNVTPLSAVKRYPKEEEKKVLCDIGYSVDVSYVSPAVGANFTYTSGACNPLNIWGVNDGIVNNAFIFQGTSSINIPINTIIGNDLQPNVVNLTCLSFVYNYPGLSLSITGGSVVVTNSGNLYCGPVLMRYFPIDVGGNQGNATYIFAYIKCPGCGTGTNLCQLVSNGGFENPTTNPACGAGGFTGLNPTCWYDWNHSCDVFSNFSCTNAFLQIGNPVCIATAGVANTYNGGTNKKCAGFYGAVNSAPNTAFNEVMENDLNNPLISGQSYQLSFWALRAGGYNNATNDVVISFGSEPTLVMNNSGPQPYPGNVSNLLANVTLPGTDKGQWKYYSTVVNFAPSVNHNYLTIGPNNPASSALNPTVTNSSFYVVVDDVSLIPINSAATLNIPSGICYGTSLPNLLQYSSIPNGTFTGQGVTTSAGPNYDFNVSGTLPAGTYSISYTYSTTTGCTYTMVKYIKIFSIVNSTPLWCNYGNYTLTATGYPAGTTYTWLPNNVNTSTLLASGSSNTTYTLLTNNPGCPVSYFTPTIIPNTVISSTPSIWCANPSATYNMTVSVPNFTLPITVTQTWSPPVSSNASVVTVNFNNILNPVYTVSTSANGCTNVASYTATWVTSPTIAIIGGTNCLTPNQTVTLQANTSSTLPVTYTWQPGNANTSSIVVTPTAITIYTLQSSFGSCVFTRTIGLYTPPQFTNVPTSICSGQSFSFLQYLIAPGTPTTGSFTGFGTYGPQLSTSFSVPVSSPPGPYPVIYSYKTPAGCFVTNTLILNVVQGVSLSITSPSVTYCANISVGATVSAIVTPSALASYTWNPGNINTQSFVATPPSNTSYTLIAAIGSCSAIGRVDVVVSNSCCPSSSGNYINTSAVNNQTFTGLWSINQDLTVFGSVVFTGEFLCAPNISITVVPGATLSSGSHTPGAVGSGLHMRSCTDMWQGINVQNGGKVIFFLQDLIEDAHEAIVSDGCTTTSGIDIDMDGVAFNRNDIAITIRNYAQTTGTPPFKIWNCVFTCRDLLVPLNSLVWPQANQLIAASGPTNTLASPYLVGGYTPTNCKAPISTRPSLFGVYVHNSGVTANPTSTAPTYYSIDIADPNGTTTNLFDNILIDVFARNSNVNTYRNIFQNTRRLQLTPTVFAMGYGISAANDEGGPNKNTRLNLVSAISPSTIVNTFYDCHFGIYAYNLFELNSQYQDYRSTQSSAVAFNNNLTGQYAIYIVGNRLKNYTIKTNLFQNVRTGVRLSIINGPLTLPSIPNFGTYLGKTTITNNLFSPTIGTVAPVGTGFIYYGVYADGILNPASGIFYEPNASLQITSNYFSRVYRASYSSNTSNKIYNTINAGNKITMISDANTPAAFQYGIQHVNNLTDIVNSNTITGTAATLIDTRVAGIYRSANTQGSTQCNSVVSVFAGFHFAGNNQGAFWRSNFMQNNQRGLNLSSNYLLSQQGTASAPSDNQWQGSWVGRNGTFTDGSNATNLSPLAVRTTGLYFPPTPGGPVAFRYSVLNPGTLILANNNAPINPCFPTPPPPCPNCNSLLVSTMNSIVTNNITYSVNPAETDEINKGLVYRDITLDPSLMDSSAILSNFNTVNTASTLGTFKSVETNLTQGNTNLAASILAVLNPNSNIENNNKIFYNIYNNYLQNSNLNVSDRLALFILAHQCPFTDGPIVYQARALHSIVTEEVKPYNDLGCEDRGYSRSPSDSSANGVSASDVEVESLLASNEKKTQATFKRISMYDIYPNPANDYFSIISNVRSEKLELKITDVSGKLLVKKSIITSNYSAELPVDLINGIYFVNLINEQGQRTTKKLVISKN